MCWGSNLMAQLGQGSQERYIGGGNTTKVRNVRSSTSLHTMSMQSASLTPCTVLQPCLLSCAHLSCTSHTLSLSTASSDQLCNLQYTLSLTIPVFNSGRRQGLGCWTCCSNTHSVCCVSVCCSFQPSALAQVRSPPTSQSAATTHACFCSAGSLSVLEETALASWDMAGTTVYGATGRRTWAIACPLQGSQVRNRMTHYMLYLLPFSCLLLSLFRPIFTVYSMGHTYAQ